MKTEAAKRSGRRGAVLLASGALLGVLAVGPGGSIAQKMEKVTGLKLTQTTADKRYIKKGETTAAGKTEETKIDKFNSTTFTPIATAKIKVPGPGFLTITGTLSAKDDATTASAQDTKLQYRLAVGSKPLTTTADSYELFLPDLALPTDNQRENGAVTGVLKQTTKGTQEVKLEAQVVGVNASAQILGRSVSVVFVPKGKLPKTTKGGKTPTGKKPPSDTPVGP
jgi:hypothetical protein